MSLLDRGFRFLVSPDRGQARWVHPAEIPRTYAEWTDVTEWPSEQLVAWLTLAS